MMIELGMVEQRYATFLGKCRMRNADKYGWDSGYADPGTLTLQNHILGAAGELVFCKWAGVYFDPTLWSFKDADVGDRIQVRLRRDHQHALIVRPGDNPDHLYVHVTGTMPKFEVRGWMLGSEAMQEKWLKTYGGRPPAYFVPTECLRELEPLRAYCHGSVMRSGEHGGNEVGKGQESEWGLSRV